MTFSNKLSEALGDLEDYEDKFHTEKTFRSSLKKRFRKFIIHTPAGHATKRKGYHTLFVRGVDFSTLEEWLNSELGVTGIENKGYVGPNRLWRMPKISGPPQLALAGGGIDFDYPLEEVWLWGHEDKDFLSISIR